MSLTFEKKIKRKLDVVETAHGNVCVCNICGLRIPRGMPRVTSVVCRKDFWGAHICAICIADIAKHIRGTYWRKIGRKTEQEMREARRVETFLDRL